MRQSLIDYLQKTLPKLEKPLSIIWKVCIFLSAVLVFTTFAIVAAIKIF